jgi:hypothetical protein
MSFELIIKCKSKQQAMDIAAHFEGDRPSEEFLNDRLKRGSKAVINNVDIHYEKDLIIINIK